MTGTRGNRRVQSHTYINIIARYTHLTTIQVEYCKKKKNQFFPASDYEKRTDISYETIIQSRYRVIRFQFFQIFFSVVNCLIYKYTLRTSVIYNQT